MAPFLAGTFGNPSGGHAAARAAKTALEDAREEVAALLGAEPGEVVFTAGGTEADNLAVKGAARAARADRRRRRRGHDRVRAQGRARVVRPPRGRGLPGRPASVPADGRRRPRRGRRRASTTAPRVVSVMLVNNEVGTIQPLDEIVAPGAGAGAGRRSSTPTRCRRCRGSTSPTRPRPRRPRRDLGAQVRRSEGHRRARRARRRRARAARRRRRPGARAALGHVERRRRGRDGRGAARHVRRARRRRRPHRARCATACVDGLLAAVPGAFENGDRAAKVAGNAHLGFRGVEAETLLVALDHAGVCAAAGSSCSSGATEPSHVLAAMGIPPRRRARRRSA